MPKATFTRADVCRAIDALQERDLPVGGVEVSPDGTWRVLTTVDKPDKSPTDGEPKRFAAE